MNAKETIRNQVMRFADPADMDVGNWDICTDNILKALGENGFAIVPKVCTEKMAEAYDDIDFRKQAVQLYNVYEQGAEVWNVMLAASTEPPKETPND